MNYASQLKGWAIDRVTEAAKAGIVKVDGIVELSRAADALADMCYVADTDFNDTVQHLARLLKEVDEPLAKVKQLQAELQFLSEDIERQLAVAAASAETVQ